MSGSYIMQGSVLTITAPRSLYGVPGAGGWQSAPGAAAPCTILPLESPAAGGRPHARSPSPRPLGLPSPLRHVSFPSPPPGAMGGGVHAGTPPASPPPCLAPPFSAMASRRQWTISLLPSIPPPGARTFGSGEAPLRPAPAGGGLARMLPRPGCAPGRPPYMAFRGLSICPSARLSATGCRLATAPCHGAGPAAAPWFVPHAPSSPRTRRKNQPRPLRAAPPDRRLKAKPPIAGSGSAPARAPPEIAGLRGGLAAAPAGARQGPNNGGYPNRDVPCFGSAPKS